MRRRPESGRVGAGIQDFRCGSVGFATALAKMGGERKGLGHTEVWHRLALGLVVEDGDWKIAHVHESVPFAMDGSERALLDLEPESAGPH